MGWLSAIGSMFSWLGGEGIGSSLARIAIGLGISKLLNKTNESGAGSNSSSTPQGTRQQIAAATDNKVPVAYGDSYFSGTQIDQETFNANKETIVALDLCELPGDIFSSSPANPSARIESDIIIDEIYLNNQLITFKSDGTTIDYTTDDTGVRDTNAQGLCGIYLYKGSSNNPMLPCTPGTRTPIAGTVPPVAYEIIPVWDNTCRNQNKIFALIKMNFDPSKGLHSLPTFKFHVRSTMNKVGDCLHDYSTNVMYGAGLPESLIDNQSIIDLNAYGDEMVTLGSYPAQPRYRCNGLARTTETVLSNMTKIAAAGGAVISYDIGTGKFAAVINKLIPKTMDFDDSNILGQLGVFYTDLTGMYNKVEVQFPYKVLKDQYNYVRFDLPEIYRNANEPVNILQITHEFVNDPVQATILANLDLRQTREDQSVTFKTDYSKYNVAIGTVIQVTNPVYFPTGKQFKVIRIKKNESDSGQLTLEITAQSYNPDVYTVEDISDFVPLIGAGHSLPGITAIQKPAKPTVASTTISSQPSISVTGIVPEGLVNLIEFWQATASAPTLYTEMGSMRPENGGLFTTGDVVTFRTVELKTETYLFRVRASYNGTSSSEFSDDSNPLAYVYVQAPDVLKYTTPTVDSSGNDATSAAGGLSLGLLAFSLASKLNWFSNGGILSGNANVSSIFGLTNSQVTEVNNAIAKDKSAYENANASTGLANQAASDAAAAKTTANQAAATAADALAAINSLGGNTAITTRTVTLNGDVFPCLFGSGPQDGAVDSRAGIFTHSRLVFAGSKVTDELPDTNVITATTLLSANVGGEKQNFYNYPSLSSGHWSKKPVYDETSTDQYLYGSAITLYYSTATYTSGNLDDQSWSAWNLVNKETGVTGLAPNTITSTSTVSYTNPIPAETNEDYTVDSKFDTNGVAVTSLTPDSAINNYDPFKPNIAITTTTISKSEPIDTRAQNLEVSLTGNYQFTAGSNNLIRFGVSVFNLPNATPFNNNTVVGHVGPKVLLTYPNAVAFKQIANNGSRFVGINAANDKVYWSDDGRTWNRVQLHSEVTTADQWSLTSTAFKYLLWDGTKFIAYGVVSSYVTTITRDYSVTPDTLVVTPNTPWSNTATSTDGKVWVEHALGDVSAFLQSPIEIAFGGGKYVAVNSTGYQTSTNGLSWTSSAAGLLSSPNTIVYDGSKFIVGTNLSTGVLVSSSDGSSWSVLPGLSDPTTMQSVTTGRDESTAKVKRDNSATMASLP